MRWLVEEHNNIHTQTYTQLAAGWQPLCKSLHLTLSLLIGQRLGKFVCVSKLFDGDGVGGGGGGRQSWLVSGLLVVVLCLYLNEDA